MLGVIVLAAIRIYDTETEDGFPEDVFKVRVSDPLEAEFTEHPARPELGGDSGNVMGTSAGASGTGIGNIKDKQHGCPHHR